MRSDSAGPALPETMYGYVWRTSRRHQLGLVALTATVFPLTMLPLELQRRIVDEAIGGRDVELLAWLCAIYLGVLLVQGVLKFALGVYRGIVSERAVRSLRERVAAHPGGAEKGTRVSMLVAEVEPVGGFVGESVAFPLLQAGVLMSVFGYMLWLEPWIALAGFALCLPQISFVPVLQGAINRRARRRIELLRALGEQLAGKGGDDSAARRRIGEVYRLRVQVFLLKFAIKFLNNFLHHLGPLAAFALGGWLAIEGRVELGTIVAFVSGFERVSDPWRELITFYRQASDARVRYRMIVDAA